MRTAWRFVCLWGILAWVVKADSPVSDPWQKAIGPRDWVFPRDHGAHPDFKTEWWYFTGNLHAVAVPARKFGFELTIFRQGLQFQPAQSLSQWAVRDFYFANFALSDIGARQFHYQERISRGALGESHAATGRMDAAVGPWKIRQIGEEESGISYHLEATERDMALDLQVRPAKPLVYEGVKGLSQKAPGVGQASYYYSYPLLTTTGKLRLGQEVIPVEGQSWFDQEFSTSFLAKNQAGWDWFCLQLDSGEEIMLYALREKAGGLGVCSQGTWVHQDGTSEQISLSDFTIEKLAEWQSPKSHATYPAQWRIKLPRFQTELTVTPALADQELWFGDHGTPAYWEGAVQVAGQVAGAKATGVGYVELTGYAQGLGEGLQEK